ncbi:sensor histidine kinase [Spirosoma jeollabukense]
MLQTAYRPLRRYLSKWELWYHAILMPVLIPVGNRYVIGPAYFSDWRIFLSATVLLVSLYVVVGSLITVAVRWVIRRYPGVHQSTYRTLAVLVVLSVLSAGAVVFDTFIYSLIPQFGTSFTWPVIRPILLATLFFDFAFCTVLSLFYAYRQWYKDQTENEQLRQATYQHQLDALKMQINPHFLFNSLTSLSTLIGENKQQAGWFVDELSKVYRYMLQANSRELVSLQTELNFIDSYSNLLQTRYGATLHITHTVDPVYLDYSLPPLSLQILIDSAMKHNAMLAGKPLLISIATTSDGAVVVKNNLQRKVIKVETSQAKLATLTSKYQLLGNADIYIEETETHFSVRLPLLIGPQIIRS